MHAVCNEFRGLYHVLGGALSPIDGIDADGELVGTATVSVFEQAVAASLRLDDSLLRIEALLKKDGNRSDPP